MFPTNQDIFAFLAPSATPNGSDMHARFQDATALYHALDAAVHALQTLHPHGRDYHCADELRKDKDTAEILRSALETARDAAFTAMHALHQI